MKEFPKRMRSIDNAKDFDVHWKKFKVFLMLQNFYSYEINCILHCINSFYFMGYDPEKFEENNEPVCIPKT